jgi:transposase
LSLEEAPGLMLVELSVVEQRYHAVMEVLAAGVPVVEVAERYGVSRKTVHVWLNLYRDGGPAGWGLADRSHRPRAHRWQVSAAVDIVICELRRAHPTPRAGDRSTTEALPVVLRHGRRSGVTSTAGPRRPPVRSRALTYPSWLTAGWRPGS